MNRVMSESYESLNQTIQNMAIVTGSLANTNDDLERMISNMASLSQQVVDADLGSALGKTSETFDNTNNLLLSLDSTVVRASSSFDRLDDLLKSAESGDGSIAKLLNDPGVYDNLDNTTKNLSLLLQDMRLNPKRYLRLSVFGRKGNQYTYPEEDPAFELEQAQKN